MLELLTSRRRTSLDCRHLLRLSGDKGMIQFAKGAEPDPESGLTVDDNARALMVALNLSDREGRELALRFVSFMNSAQRDDGTWCNWWLPKKGFVPDLDSEDSIGRAFLACSLGMKARWPEVARVCRNMLEKSLPVVPTLRYPRSVAYTVIAGAILAENSQDYKDWGWRMAKRGVQDLVSLYIGCKGPDWRWFEDEMTYCNGVLPHALFAYYILKGDKKVIKVAKEALNFLADQVFSRGFFTPIGNRGWFKRGGLMPSFDQQPVEACSMALCCWEAFYATGNEEYRQMAQMACDWYLGRNVHGLPLYDQETGGCHDGLTPEGLNLNQGAEALLSLLLALQANKALQEESPLLSQISFWRRP